MLTRDPKTGQVMRDSHADVADQLFGLGRRRKRGVRVPKLAIRPRHRPRQRPGRLIARAPLPQYAAPTTYSAPVAYQPQPEYAEPVAQEAVQQSAPEPSYVPEEEYNGSSDEAIQTEGCCGGYLISHATEPNIYPYENPKTWGSALRKKPLGRGAYFEDRRPKHPPTYAEALRTRRMPPGMGHYREDGYLPFESRGMGQVTEAQKAEAARTYPLIVSGVTAALNDLAKTRPADWDANLANAKKMFDAQLTAYKNFVHEKLGDADAELKLRRLLLSLLQTMSTMRQNAPSEWKKGWDSFTRWFGDFINGAKQAVNDYMAWAKARALEVLRKYYDARIKIDKLHVDLNQARASGKFGGGQLAAQAVKIGAAEAALRSASLTIPGLGSPLDVIAQEQFGKYPTVQAAAAAIPAATIVAWAFVILAAATLAFGIGYLISSAGGGGGIALIAVAVVGVILVARG